MKTCNHNESVRNQDRVVGAEPCKCSGHPKGPGCISIAGVVVTETRAELVLGSAHGTCLCRCKRREELSLLRCAPNTKIAEHVNPSLSGVAGFVLKMWDAFPVMTLWKWLEDILLLSLGSSERRVGKRHPWKLILRTKLTAFCHCCFLLGWKAEGLLQPQHTAI